MNILYLTHRLPYPPNKGDKIRSYRFLRHLAESHTVFLACPIDDQQDLQHVEQVRAWAKGGVSYRPLRRWARAAAGRNLLVNRPISNAYFYTRELQRDVDGVLGSHDIDLVICFSSPMAEYVFRSKTLSRTCPAPALVMDMIDVDSHKWRDYAAASRFPIRWIYAQEARTLRRYERLITQRFDQVLLVSDPESELLADDAGSSNIVTVTNGVDLDHFNPAFESHTVLKGRAIVFTGAMDYKPNIDGVTWFAEKVLPIVRRSVPDATFYIVGSRPAGSVQRLAAIEGVQVTGFVDDVREYLAAAAVCVAPLQVARGIQNKVLESMAMAKPTVVTAEALAGIRGASDAVLVGDTPHSFAEGVVQLLLCRQSAVALGIRARSAVEANHSWESALAGFGSIVGQSSRRSREAA